AAVQSKANEILRDRNAALALANARVTRSIAELQAAKEATEQANAGLRAANAKVEARYNLAVDAIRTFHTGVSEAFLLKQDQFKDLRDRLLRSAANFYEKL